MSSAKRVAVAVTAALHFHGCAEDRLPAGPEPLLVPDPSGLLVTRVLLTPELVRLDTVATQQFRAQAIRLLGDTVDIAEVFSATGGSIDQDGLYTAGRYPGSYRAVARHVESGKADTSRITIEAGATAPPPPPPPPPGPPPPPPPAPPPGGNEPAGFTAIVERPFDSKAATDSDRGTGSYPGKTGGSEGWDGAESRYPLLTIQSDPSAPNGAPHSVMRFEYPPQTVASGTTFSPGVAQTLGFNSGTHGSLQYDQLYVRFWFKLGATFQNHSAGTKLMFFRSSQTSSGWFEPFAIVLGQPGYIRMAFNLQGTPDNGRGHLQPNLNTSGTDVLNLRLDQWYKVEVLLGMNSAYDRPDGILRAWLDGTEVFNYDDIRYRRDAFTRHVWAQVHVAPTWGGQGGTITRTFYWYLDHLYASGR